MGIKTLTRYIDQYMLNLHQIKFLLNKGLKKKLPEIRKVVGHSQKQCMICQTKCKNRLGESVKEHTHLGQGRSLHMLQFYRILAFRRQLVCNDCNQHFDTNILQKILLKRNRLKTWDTRNKNYLKWLLEMDTSNIIKAGLKIVSKVKTHLNLLIQMALDQTCLEEKEITLGNRLYRNSVGLTPTQFKELMRQIYITFNGERFKKVFLGGIQKNFYLDQTKHRFNIKSVLALLIKLRVGISNKQLCTLFHTSHIYTYYYHGTALLESFKDKFLINTAEKLNSLTKYDIIRKLLKVPSNQHVVCADGVRFRTQKSRTDFDSQKITWDTKHQFNGVSFIGMNEVDRGYFCGFYPECATSTDGAHWDGRVLDYLILNNTDGLLYLIKLNSAPFQQNGTLIIMDRCLGCGCLTLQHGLVWYKYPCTSKKKILTVIQGNRSRTDATLHRWVNEGSFGRIKKKWAYFRFQTHTKLVPILGKWLNIAASIMNYFKMGLVTLSEERKKYLQWMDVKITQEKINPGETNVWSTTLKKFRYDKDLMGEYGPFWHKCETVEDIISISTYWSKDRLKKLFNCTNDDLKIIAGGMFTIKQGWSYLISSVTDMGIYVSTFKEYKKLIMIRNIKRKNSSKLSVRAYEAKDEPEKANPTCHHIILCERPHFANIQGMEDLVGYRPRTMYWCCNCVAGSKSLNADSHVMAGLIFLKYKINKKKIPTNFVVEKYWNNIIHVQKLQNFFKHYSYEKRQLILTKWMKDQNQKYA